jgi:heme A synthase
MSTAHDVRAQSRKEESTYDLAILAASLSALLCIAGAEIVIFHIAFVLTLTKIALWLAATVATSLLTTLLATLAGASWRLLTANILALIMTSTTHVPLEIVVLHSVVCHVCLYSPICSNG